MSDHIALEDCEEGCVYSLSSRNLGVGVFKANSKGFIGIREKFMSRFLFQEYHWDCGAPYGTARPLKKLAKLPEGMPLTESLGSEDIITKRAVAFDKPLADGGKGWFFVDTGEGSKDINPVNVPNKALFDFLQGLENASE